MFKHGKSQYYCGDHHFAITGEGSGKNLGGSSMSSSTPKGIVDTPQSAASDQPMQMPKQPVSARAAPTKRGKPPTPAMTPGTQELYRNLEATKRTDRNQTPSGMIAADSLDADAMEAFSDIYENGFGNSENGTALENDSDMQHQQQNGMQDAPPSRSDSQSSSASNSQSSHDFYSQQQAPHNPVQYSQHPQHYGNGMSHHMQYAPSGNGMHPQFMAMPPSGPPASLNSNLAVPGIPRRTSLTSQKAAQLLTAEGQTTSPNTAMRAAEAAREAAMAMSRSFGGYSQGTSGTTSINSVDLLNKMLETKSDKGLMLHGDLDTSNDGRTIRPKYWTAEEDEKLRKAVEQYGPRHWKDIATFVPGRTHVQCLQRWNKVLKPGLRKGAWTEEEDLTLTQLVESSDSQPNWSEIADSIPGRSAKQCRERWSFNLDPSINKGEWTAEEDRILLDSQVKLGNKWSQIAMLLPGRTENAIKTRHKSIIRAKRREWRPSEDALLLSYQRDYGNRWDEIAARLSNRTKNAVKMRFKFLTEDNVSDTTKQSDAKESTKSPSKSPVSASKSTEPGSANKNPGLSGAGELGTSNTAAAAANAKAAAANSTSDTATSNAAGMRAATASGSSPSEGDATDPISVKAEGASQSSSSSTSSSSKGLVESDAGAVTGEGEDKDAMSVSTRSLSTSAEDVLKRRSILQRTGACQSSKAAASSKEARARARKAAAAAVAAAEAAARQVSEQQAAQMQQYHAQAMHPYMNHPNMHPMAAQHMMHPQGHPAMQGHMYPYGVPPGYPPAAYAQGMPMNQAGPYMYPSQMHPGAHTGYGGPQQGVPAPNFKPMHDGYQGGPSSSNAASSSSGSNPNSGHQSSVGVVSMGTLGSTTNSTSQRDMRGANNKVSKVMLSEMLEDLANMDFDPLDNNSRDFDSSAAPTERSNEMGYNDPQDSGFYSSQNDTSIGNAYNSAFDGLNLDDLET